MPWDSPQQRAAEKVARLLASGREKVRGVRSEKTMAIALKQLDDATRMDIDGVLDISIAEELKSDLLSAVATPLVRVDLSAVTYLDVTAIQLLWAAQHAAELKDVPLVFEASIPDSVRTALRDAGFQEMLTLLDQASPLKSSAGEMR